MSEAPLSSVFDSCQMWLSTRSHRQRIGILLIGWVIIFFIWYQALQKPLKLARAHIAQESDTVSKQIDIFKAEADKIAKENDIRVSAQQKLIEQNKHSQKIELAKSSDIDIIIKKMLSIQHEINFVSLKTNLALEPSTPNALPLANTIELTFNGNYFNTIAYLEELEKIPWCLSWDSIVYTVTSYPNASVAIHMSIVSNEQT